MTENSLRLALLVIGLLILAGIYIYSRWRSEKQVNDIFAASHRNQADVLLEGDPGNTATESVSGGTERIEPELEITPPDIDEIKEDTVSDKPQVSEQATLQIEENTDEETATAVPETPVPTEQPQSQLPKRLKLIVMHLMPREGKQFAGAAVLKALQAHKLRFGEMQIFHRITQIDDQDKSVFSVANMVKPGTLIPDELADEKLPGVSFFLRLPAPIDSLKAYDDMLHCIQHMATTLNGDIKDEEFMTLSREKIALQRAQLF